MLNEYQVSSIKEEKSMREIKIFFAIYLFSFAPRYGQSFDQMKIKQENYLRENNIHGGYHV